MYYDVVKSTYSEDMNVRIDSELVLGGFDNEYDACKKARELIVDNTLDEHEFYEVEQKNENGELELIIEP